MVRTSILSSKWVDLWISIPYLVFEEECDEWELIMLVNMVLKFHQGPIRQFKLVSDHACNKAIGRWLLILSKNGIKDLEFVINDDIWCNIPYHLISCTALERLSLEGCIISAPLYLQGFKLLHALILSESDLLGISIENTVASCPLLDHLELSDFVERDCLRILTPKLTFLYISGVFHDIILETPKLASGCIHLVDTTRDYQEFSVARNDKESNILRALGCLSSIQKLDICGEFLDYLSIGPIPENLPVVFNHLTSISLHLCIYPDEIAAALCLFENAPNLEILHMEFTADVDRDQPNIGAAWESKVIKDCLFKHLRVVNIMYGINKEAPVAEFILQSTKSMLQFAKFVLSTASVLEKLNFIKLKDEKVFLEMLKWFPKLSEMAEIVFVPGSGQ